MEELEFFTLQLLLTVFHFTVNSIILPLLFFSYISHLWHKRRRLDEFIYKTMKESDATTEVVAEILSTGVAELVA